MVTQTFGPPSNNDFSRSPAPCQPYLCIYAKKEELVDETGVFRVLPTELRQPKLTTGLEPATSTLNG